MRVVALLKMAEEAEHHCVGLYYDSGMKILTEEEVSKTKRAYSLRGARPKLIVKLQSTKLPFAYAYSGS